jgi:hypothetical protein
MVQFSGAGLVSTVDDYFAFSRFLSRKGRIGDRQFLSEASIEAMTHDHLTPAQRAGGQAFRRLDLAGSCRTALSE